MKKKIRVRFDSLKRGDCFRLTSKGPIYIKDSDGLGVGITSVRLGSLAFCSETKYIYPTTVKIVEEK